jgi:hypothetical protein
MSASIWRVDPPVYCVARADLIEGGGGHRVECQEVPAVFEVLVERLAGDRGSGVTALPGEDYHPRSGAGAVLGDLLVRESVRAAREHPETAQANPWCG